MKTIIITGASGGLGKAIAEKLYKNSSLIADAVEFIISR